MPPVLYTDTNYQLSHLLQEIRHGSLALPEMQRPFVWNNAKVRDLFDSMYRGFPVGTLLLWKTGAKPGTRQIGVDYKARIPELLIVDGQQRLTSMYAVMTATPVKTKHYYERRIRLAFNPIDQQFEVRNAAISKDPEFIPDITALWRDGYRPTIRSYFKRLKASCAVPLSEKRQDDIEDCIDRVRDLQNYRFQVIELSTAASVEEVSDIFVRINSQGVRLDVAQFILTLMSVYMDKQRVELEEFCRDATRSDWSSTSPRNALLDPTPAQMLRVSVGIAFRRARLGTVYSLLRGKGLEDEAIADNRRDQQLRLLRKAQSRALNLANWHEYLKCLRTAGFLSKRMIASKISILYAYVIWLIGRYDFNLDCSKLQHLISRWFFMVHTTRRYTGSGETQLESDLRRLSDLPAGNGNAFCMELDRIVHSSFTSDYWKITLPNQLDTAASRSPVLYAYWASLNLLEAEQLGGRQKVRELFAPNAYKSLERHHLFPQSHLKSLGIDERRHLNAIANMSFIDRTSKAYTKVTLPADYWLPIARSMSSERLKNQCFWHALPSGWEQMKYSEFLERRRRMIAEVIREGFTRLLDEAEPTSLSLEERIEAGESESIEFKSTARWNMRTRQRDKRMEHAVVKTICGFLNSGGGELIIGVDDNGDPIGLAHDLSTFGKKPNHDGFELFLRSKLDGNLSVPTAALVNIKFKDYRGTTVCVLSVSGSSQPVFARPLQGSRNKTDFWVRNGNSTQRLYGDAMLAYQKEIWN